MLQVLLYLANQCSTSKHYSITNNWINDLSEVRSQCTEKPAPNALQSCKRGHISGTWASRGGMTSKY